MNAPSAPVSSSRENQLAPLALIGLVLFALAGGFEWAGRVLGGLGETLTGRPRQRTYPTYTAETLRAKLDAFETRYGMTSEEWAERYARGERLPADKAEAGLAGFDETVWSSTWREYLALRDSERARLGHPAAAA